VRAIVRAEPWADQVAIYLAKDYGFGPARALSPQGHDRRGDVEWVEFPEGTEPPALLRLSRGAAEMLAKALNEYVPAIPATEDALKDTRIVRDRLLTLVEQITTERRE
jgi:hypothetical protein